MLDMSQLSSAVSSVACQGLHVQLSQARLTACIKAAVGGQLVLVLLSVLCLHQQLSQARLTACIKAAVGGQLVLVLSVLCLHQQLSQARLTA